MDLYIYFIQKVWECAQYSIECYMLVGDNLLYDFEIAYTVKNMNQIIFKVKHA